MTSRTRQEDVERSIIDSVDVTLQQVTIAKAFILKNFSKGTRSVINRLVSAMDCTYPDKIELNQGEEDENNRKLKHTAESLSWIRAGCEAIWALISSGILIPQGGTSTNLMPDLQYSIKDCHGGGVNGGLDLSCLQIEVPQRILLPRSVSGQNVQILTDPDLFLHTIDITNLHHQVETSLREAVRCFRNELFLACLAMLGRASEGAWLELGLGLVSVVPPDSSPKPERTKANLESPFVGIGKKILDVLKLYEHRDVLGDVHKQSEVTIQDLRNAVIWSDCVRESRNSIHYGVEPSMPNTYEKVAALLIAAVPHFRLIYRIIEATTNISRATEQNASSDPGEAAQPQS